MNNKPKQKLRDSSWTDEWDKFSNPLRQKDEREADVETPRDQRASRSDEGSSESQPSDKRGEPQRDRDQDASGRRRTPDE